MLSKVSATSPRGRGLQDFARQSEKAARPGVSATSPRGRGLQAAAGSISYWTSQRFQRHRPVAGDCKQTLQAIWTMPQIVSATSPRGRGLQVIFSVVQQISCLRFSDIAPWQGTARNRTLRPPSTCACFSDIAPWQGTASAPGETGLLTLLSVSATSPRGRGLQVPPFQPHPLWHWGFSDIAPWQGTASCRGFWWPLYVHWFQRHRPVAGDCKTVYVAQDLLQSQFQRHRPVAGDCKTSSYSALQCRLWFQRHRPVAGDCKWRTACERRVDVMFQRHRPVAGDCKYWNLGGYSSFLAFQRHRPVAGDCKFNAYDPPLQLFGVSATSPRGRGLQDERAYFVFKSIQVSATSPRGRGLQVCCNAKRLLYIVGFSDIAPWQGTARTITSNRIGVRQLFQRHRPVAGDCKAGKQHERQLSWQSFSDIAPWQGTARGGIRTLSGSGVSFSDIAPWQGTARGAMCQAIVVHDAFQRHRPVAGDCKCVPHAIRTTSIRVSATSPRGRGLQEVSMAI